MYVRLASCVLPPTKIAKISQNSFAYHISCPQMGCVGAVPLVHINTSQHKKLYILVKNR